jgi:prepilin-type N-terminal cleavage/methylation domain-containing protein
MKALIQSVFQSPDPSGLRLAFGGDKRTLNVNRKGFTLIELLVVIAMIMVLAGIAVMFVPRIEEGQRASRGAALLQGWLNVAKQRALRDQQARGLRLYVDPTTNLVTECQYLDLPDDFTGGTISQGGSANQVTTTADLYGGFGAGNSALWPVQPGDYLLILNSGLVHQISSIPNKNTLNLASNLPFTLSATANYKILRSPRVSGEEKLSLPQYVGINIATNATYANATYGNNLTRSAADNNVIDILFAPSGNIIGDQAGTDKVILWVCDYSLAGNADPLQNAPWGGEPSLITVFTRSGLVAPVPVDPNGINYPGNPSATPYTFTPNP